MRHVVKVLAFGLVVLAAAGAHAAIPQELAWQGVVLDSNNVPLADGVYDFHFRIYSDDVGGSPLWDETQAVHVQSGVLNVLLGHLTPIPDSVFSGPARFLEVQFEDQAAYVPRTRVVSVGYSYRTASVDGALSGGLTGDLSVAGGVEASSFTVAPPPTALDAASGGGVDITVSPQGGVVQLRDELNDQMIFMGPDPDGQGGQITVASNPAGTTGILLEGNSDGSGEPHLAIVGTQSALNFDLKPGGEISLVLPPGTITSDQILDESGVASGAQPGAVTDIGENFRSLACATATFPTDGYAVVFAEATFRGECSESWLDGQLKDGDAVAAAWYWDAGDLDHWYDQRQTYVHAQAVTAGTHTFELKVRQTRGRTDAIDARITVLYVPTAYGLVATSAGTGSTEAADSTQSEPPTAQDINLPAEKTASIAANDARIQAELDLMAQRLAELQAELVRSRTLPVGEP